MFQSYYLESVAKNAIANLVCNKGTNVTEKDVTRFLAGQKIYAHGYSATVSAIYRMGVQDYLELPVSERFKFRKIVLQETKKVVLAIKTGEKLPDYLV